MVNNYNNGKVYKIESHLGDKVYYGSTTKKLLSQRMTKHRSDYKCWLKGKRELITSFNLFEEYGLENCKIILVESCPCETKDELKARESYYIRNFECVNKVIPDRTMKEYYEDNKSKILERAKEYQTNNKVKISEQKKEYQTNNKVKISEQKKEYRTNNKVKISEHMKEYHEDNKVKISEQKKIKITCECGSICRKAEKSRHERSIKHINFINSQ